jgi:DNA-binding GntR family transcriptional regulator
VGRIEAVSMVDRVTDELRRAIVLGAMPPGQEFSLRQIAGQLGISFIPVREALRTLEADGLLITRRGRSAVVPPLDLDGLEAIFRLRRLIEPDLMARSAALTTAAELDAALHEHRRARPQPDLNRHLEEHLAFNAALVRPAASEWDMRILMRLWQGAARYGYAALAVLKGEIDLVHDARERMAELLVAYRAGDSEQVRAACVPYLNACEALDRIAVPGAARG